MAIVVSRTAPPAVIAGFTATPDYGFEKCYNMESGVLVDRTLEFQNAATPVDSFAAQNDYIYLGVKSEYHTNYASVTDGRFISVYINLDTVASASIVPTFEYNTGNNTWATLAVTDGTAGFTQSGEISVTLASLPGYTTWKKGSQNGSGGEIGDSVDRCYLRIKRTVASLTTPPQIIEAGTGELTANTTYYYRANTLATPAIYATSSNALMSAPCSEISATTTDYKRSIKLSWTGDSKHHLIWRTATSGNYDGAGKENMLTSEIDTKCQVVKGKYINMRSTSVTTDTSLMDTGLSTAFTRYSTSTTVVYSQLSTWMFYEYERGQIVVSGGDAVTPAKWRDIYLADAAGGWNSFIHIASTDVDNLYSSWDCRDNLVIDGYITDKNFDITLRGSKYSYSDTTFETYGEVVTYTNTKGTTGHIYKNGGAFNFLNSIAADYYCRFTNCIMYDCRINQGVNTSPEGSHRTYMHLPYFVGNNNKLYNTIINGGGALGLEDAVFSGTGLILEDVTINGSRYGLTVDAGSFATASFKRLKITGATGICADDIPDGASVVFDGFSFRYMSSRTQTCYLNSSTKDKVVNTYYIDTDLDVVTAGAFNKSHCGINYTLYEQNRFNLNVQLEDGTAVSGATAEIKYGATELFNKTTDGSGDITTSVITYKEYRAGTVYNATYYSYYSDSVTTYASHTVTISKAGYETVILPLVMDSKQDLKVVLKPAVKFMYDENNNIYEKKNKENLTTLKRNRICGVR